MGLEAGSRVGAYEIVGRLGAGGMGSVYRARDTRLGRQVAIKVISDEHATDRAAVARMEREARLTSALSHPNIVTIHDVGEIDGSPYIVMELVEGQTLHARMASGELTLAEAVGIGSQVADGLATAHAAGAIHRDLTPRNIMVTPTGQPKIVDFGLGKSAPVAADSDAVTNQREITDTHAIIGTAGYMSPEQVSRRTIDFRTDQFSLGAILYEMISGERAFRRETPLQTMVSIVESEPRPLGEIVPDAPAELQTVISRCLCKDPGGRYASTHDLARDLHDVRQVLTSGSRSASHRSRAQPLPRPFPVRQAIAAVLVLALAVAGWAWFNRSPSVPEQSRVLLSRYDVVENVDLAIAKLTEFIATHPDNAEAHALLAEAYWRKSEYLRDKEKERFINKASQEARTALKLNEKLPRTHVALALINTGQSRFEGAVEEARRAIDLDGRNAPAWRELGRAQEKLNRMDEAERSYLTSLELDPNDWSTHNLLGTRRLLSNRAADAIPSFRRALQIAPDIARVLNNLGSSLYFTGKIDDAAATYERSLSIAPSATAAQNLGKIYYDKELYADAARAYDASVSLPGATAMHWRNLGSAAYFVPGLREKSKAAFEQAVALAEPALATNPKDPVTLTALANSYAVLSTFTEDSRALAWREKARTTATDASRLVLQDAGHLSALAGAHELMGDREQALLWLKKAVDAGYPVKSVLTSPWLRELRTDPRFEQAIRPRKPPTEEQ